MSTWRDRVGTSLFLRVAGPDGVESRARIHGTPGPRWFEPDAAIRRVHGDASMFVGGLRALLLQSLHPLAMAGVAGHSGYRGDPWGRLARTSTFLAETTFATADDAQAAVDRVRAVHARVRGRAPDGRPYRADDPELLTWVHVAEVDSFLHAHQRLGARPLDAAGQDAYVAQAATVARRLGVPDPPETVAALAEALAAFRPALGAGEQARDTARFLLTEPPVPWSLRPGYALLASAAASSLPAWAAAELGVGPRPTVRRRLDHAGGVVVTRTIRWLLGADDASRVAPHPHDADDAAPVAS
ncbi:oxygenase MpaB family protein [Cellulomonas massiliensis]|uniref:oxygenase MpaB family protein n=1 Tax=Cellulomonas massiliensis TaxID=1465811 RepID=UPI00030D6F93|nr:oxygenase MpaB family protein [Cellulomonas massiliensis]